MNEDAAREQAEIEKVRARAARMARARRRKQSLWQQLAQVGVLGWLLILPLVGLTALGRFLGARLDRPYLALVGMLAGLGLGAYLVWRNVERSLRDEDDPPR